MEATHSVDVTALTAGIELDSVAPVGPFVRPFLMVRTKTETNIKCVSVFVEIRCPGLMVLTDPQSVRGIGSYLKTNTIISSR